MDVDLLRRVMECVGTEALEPIAVRGIECPQVALEVLVGDQVEEVAHALRMRLLPQRERSGVAMVEMMAELVEDEAFDDLLTVRLAAQHRQRRHEQVTAVESGVAELLLLRRHVNAKQPAGELDAA